MKIGRGGPARRGSDRWDGSSVFRVLGRDAPVRAEIPDDLTDHRGSLVSLKVISRVDSHLSAGFKKLVYSAREGPEEAGIHSVYNGEDAFADELAGPVRRSGSSARRRRRAT